MMQEIEKEYGALRSVHEREAATVVDITGGKKEVLVFELEFEKGRATERLTFMSDNRGQMRLWMLELS